MTKRGLPAPSWASAIYVEELRKESRLLRIYTAQLKRANIVQKDKLKKIEDILKNKDKHIRNLKELNHTRTVLNL